MKFPVEISVGISLAGFTAFGGGYAPLAGSDTSGFSRAGPDARPPLATPSGDGSFRDFPSRSRCKLNPRGNRPSDDFGPARKLTLARGDPCGIGRQDSLRETPAGSFPKGNSLRELFASAGKLTRVRDDPCGIGCEESLRETPCGSCSRSSENF